MLRFSFRRDKDKEFKHIAPGLIPAASIAPKPAVPRTPPPRSPDPSPERPRSALAAAILSSSLTGQTWALPSTRPRSFSEGEQSESLISEPNISTALYTRDRWSEDLASRPRLSSPDQSDEELDHNQEEEEEEEEVEEVEDEEDREEHVYQSLDRRQEDNSITEPVYAQPLKPKISRPQPTRRSVRRAASPAPPPVLTSDQPVRTRDLPPSPESSRSYRARQREGGRSGPPEKNKKTSMAEDQKLLEEKLQRLEQEISHSRTSLNMKPPTGRAAEAELQSLRRQAQELVDENDALKMTVHRLNVELSRYQSRFRPLAKHQSEKISGLPKSGSPPPPPPPPWLVDMKYLSPLLLAYDDRINEKDELLQNTEEEVKRLRARAEEVIKENERLSDEIAKIGGVRQEDCQQLQQLQQLQQQAILVLQENQGLMDQLEAQHLRATEELSRHHAEVSKVSKQLMLVEVEKQRLQEELQETKVELQKSTRDVQALRTRLKDAITFDEHCHVTGKLRRQLEQQESRSRSDMEELRLRLSSLQEENRALAVDKADLTAKLKEVELDLDLAKQANRKAERRVCVLRRQKEECVLTEAQTRYYMGAVVSVAQTISQERDQLIQMASLLQQEKQRFMGRLAKGTARFGKLQEEVKVYRRQASTRLAELEEAAEGRTASHQREILHLQRLLAERQEAEERLLQSKREVEEELEAVWQATTRENQRVRDMLSDPRPLSGSHGWDVFPPDEIPQSPGPSPLLKTDSEDKHKHGLDFYC